MIVEQIRYYGSEENREALVEVRREITRLRANAGVPGGQLLVADAVADEGPCVVWQCGYTDEGEMAMAETCLFGNQEYISARERLGSLAARVELELYISDEAPDVV